MIIQEPTVNIVNTASGPSMTVNTWVFGAELLSIPATLNDPQRPSTTANDWQRLYGNQAECRLSYTSCDRCIITLITVPKLRCVMENRKETQKLCDSLNLLSNPEYTGGTLINFGEKFHQRHAYSSHLSTYMFHPICYWGNFSRKKPICNAGNKY